MGRPFEIHAAITGNVIETLLDLGKQTGVCFGVNVRDGGNVRAKMTIRAGKTNLRSVLAQLGAPESYSVERGVLVITIGRPQKRIRAKDWLDKTLPMFEVQRMPIEDVSAKLFVYLRTAGNPHTGGIIGSISSTADSPSIQPFSIRYASAKTILTTILARSTGAGMWFTIGPHPTEAPPTQSIWTMLFYSDGPSVNRWRIEDAIARYPF